MKNNKLFRRSLSVALALTMCASLMSNAALANGIDENGENEWTILSIRQVDSELDDEINDEIIEKTNGEANKETTDEEITDEETTDEETTDEEATNEEATNEEATNEEATNEEATNEEATNEETTDEETTDEETTNEETTNEETTNEETTDEETTNEETTNEETTNEETTNEETPDEETSGDQTSGKPEEDQNTLPIVINIKLQDHYDVPSANGEETMPEVQVEYSYNLNGETVTGTYICNAENGEWVFDPVQGVWSYRYDLPIPENATDIKAKQSNYNVTGYIASDGCPEEVELQPSAPKLSFNNVYTILSHASVDVTVGKVTGEDGEDKTVETEDGKLVTDYQVGDTITYEITVKNDGNDGIYSMYLTVEFPEGLEFVSATPSSPVYKKGDEGGGFVYTNGVVTTSKSIRLTNDETLEVGAGTYLLMIGAGYGDDPLAVIGSTETVTLVARVIQAIESGDLELKAAGTLITGPKSDASVIVYAPEVPDEPPVIVIPPVDPDPYVPEDDDDDDEPTPVVIPEEDVPLVEIPEENVPLVETPDVEIPEEDVPLAETPDVEIPDEDAPLADVPQTMDSFLLETIAVLTIGVSALWLALDKKRKA